MPAQRMSRQEWAEKSSEKVASAQAILAESVSALVTGEDWMAYLSFQAKLHNYSIGNNVMLIARQHAQAFIEGRVVEPMPSFVAGFNTWKALGRTVDKGQHGYAVLAPVIGHHRRAAGEDGDLRPLGKDEVVQPGETEERRKALYVFKVEHVFDGQTSGRPVPEVPHPKLLAGEAPDGLGAAVMALIESRGFTVDTAPNAGSINGTNGQTNWGTKSVVIRADMDDAAMVKTLIHEAGHCLLHFDAPGCYLPRPLKDVEAESVAFVVAAAHGLPTDGYSFHYVAGWAGGDDPAKAIRATQSRVGQAARLIIEASPAPHEAGGKVPGAAAAVEATRQARLEQARTLDPVETGVGV